MNSGTNSLSSYADLFSVFEVLGFLGLQRLPKNPTKYAQSILEVCPGHFRQKLTLTGIAATRTRNVLAVEPSRAYRLTATRENA